MLKDNIIIISYLIEVQIVFNYIMKAILAATVIGVSLHPLIVNELRTNTADFPKVNS